MKIKCSLLILTLFTLACGSSGDFGKQGSQSFTENKNSGLDLKLSDNIVKGGDGRYSRVVTQTIDLKGSVTIQGFVDKIPIRVGQSRSLTTSATEIHTCGPASSVQISYKLLKSDHDDDRSNLLEVKEFELDRTISVGEFGSYFIQTEVKVNGTCTSLHMVTKAILPLNF